MQAVLAQNRLADRKTRLKRALQAVISGAFFFEQEALCSGNIPRGTTGIS
ncbi:MAG TPA: hypothetical protein H9668_06490 [Firmicutes bacterium]|nr:hypothetical protein [Bacillota bacterium]